MEEKMVTIFGYTSMSLDTFNIIAGIASILGLIATFFVGKSVNSINKTKSLKQNIDARGSSKNVIHQAGRDINQ